MRVSRFFWSVTLLAFLLINENFAQWALAVFVGGYSLSGGFVDAYQFFTLRGYLFFSGFRTIPYIFLYIVIKLFTRFQSRFTKSIAWSGLIGLVGFILLTYWDLQYGYYADIHVSSTMAIAFLFMPTFAIPVMIVLMIFGVIVQFINEKRKGKRESKYYF